MVRRGALRFRVLCSRAQAWNVDGSSDDVLEGSSWIRHWEEATGSRRGQCSCVGCGRAASVGGHVWLKGRGVHLAPICAGCNSCDNAGRMQHAEGRHPELKARTRVVPLRMTEGMRRAERRLARDVRECRCCGADIGGRPAHHEECLSCFRSARKRQRRERECRSCGVSIESSPAHHWLCRGCFADGEESGGSSSESEGSSEEWQ